MEKIPVPLSQKWRELRVRVLPVLVFAIIAGVVVWLWKERTEATHMVGHVVGKQAEIRSPQSGSLADLSISAFDSVAAGEPIGRLVTTDPKIVEAELAVVLAEIELTRLTMDPIADRQRNLLNYESMQMDLMENKARYGIAGIRKEQARRELERVQRMDERGLTTEEARDRAETEYRSLKEEVEVLEELIDRLSARLENIDLDDVMDKWKQEDPKAAAIKVHQRALERIEAEMMPVVLQAPVSGQVADVYRSNGEFVEEGDVIMQIRSPRPDYILGHVRHPVFIDPEPGMNVLVRKQTRDRQEAMMQITEVGVQMETIEEMVPLFPEQPFETIGLPVRIELNNELDLRPGEVVDVRLVSR